MNAAPRCLPDVNVLIALASQDHVHHAVVREWFYATRELQWALCALTEAGFLRYTTAPRPGQITMAEATKVLAKFTQHPGYRYQPLTVDWPTLSRPFLHRVYGTKQVTDAYLLGLALQEELLLVTLDKAFLHLAQKQFSHRVLLLHA